jgi:phage terminase small subunit
MKQRIFVDEYIENKGNGTKAALKAYDTDKDYVAKNIASENLTKPNVWQAIQDAAEEAFGSIRTLSKTAKNENVRLGASKDILDRAGFKPVEERKNLNVDLKLEIDNGNYLKIAEILNSQLQTDDNSGTSEDGDGIDADVVVEEIQDKE